MMASIPKRPEPYSRAIDRELIELAKTMDLEAIAKKTGRKRKNVLKMARRLGIKITMVDAR
jgi:ribosomal protein L32E